MLKKRDDSFEDEAASIERWGKSLLHLGVEHVTPKIVEFLLFETGSDPNLLTHNSQMSSLHLAVSRMQAGIIEMLLMHENSDPNLVSPLHGTPLHIACKNLPIGSTQVKIVQ